MTGTEEAFARKGKMAPRIIWRELDRKIFRRFCIAAVAAAIFVCAASTPAAARLMTNANVVRPTSGFQNFIFTLCWLAGAGFSVCFLVKLWHAMEIPRDDPQHVRLRNMSLLCAILGFAALAFPYAEVYVILPYNDANPSADQLQRLVRIVAWYFALAAFAVGDLNLRQALRLGGDPANAVPKAHAAVCFAAGFLMLTLPTIFALMTP